MNPSFFRLERSTCRPFSVRAARQLPAIGLWTLCILIGLAAPAQPPASVVERPAAWARPLEVVGVPNLHQLNANLYRSAQPTAEGMLNLKQRGIKTVLNLRSFHSDRDEIGDSGLDYEHLYMKAWHPEEEELVRFLTIVTDPARTPVLVHCQHGADRTGLLCAVYRIAVEGWSKDEAIAEMTEGGYGFHSVWPNIITEVRELDVDSLRVSAGLDPGSN
jgi:protein tyrosine phosphatase (PTP) superfamily phosphohydrolase (DUF442 family)